MSQREAYYAIHDEYVSSPDYPCHLLEYMRRCFLAGQASVEARTSPDQASAAPDGTAPSDPPQEYGQDHPWKAFDRWHKEHHDIAGYTWPCREPMRCFWRYTRKTGIVLDQNGAVPSGVLSEDEGRRQFKCKTCGKEIESVSPGTAIVFCSYECYCND